MSDSDRNPFKWVTSGLMRYVTVHNDTYPFIDPTKADLSAKSVLVTGASKGIGKATAISFASAGCSQIAIAARSDLGEIAEAVKLAAGEAGRPEPKVLVLKLDVRSEESVAAAAEAVTRAFGGTLDILINNAGYLETWKPVAESDPKDWWHTWEVNVKGIYLCSRFFIPLLLKSETRTIFNISSAGAHNIVPGGSAYAGTKFAVSRFTEFLDQEYYEQGLVAITMHPGGVATELARNMPDYLHGRLIDTPELAADALVWLSRERREWLAGRFISAEWDMEELEKKKPEILGRDLLKFRMRL